MLREPTTFIVGAGASAEFGLPTGNDLQAKISKLLDIRYDAGRMTSGDHQIFEVLRNEAANEAREYQQACWRIRDGLALSLSIDNFMDKHNEDNRIQLAGRLAIAKSILEAERSSSLRIDESRGRTELDFQSNANSWAKKLYVLMQDGRKLSDVKNFFDRSTFVIFNYDRCVEHYFLHALVRNYGISTQHAASIINEARFYHPYGTVGDLPWCQTEKPAVNFGEMPWSIRDIASGIRTYTDQVDDPTAFDHIKTAVGDASCVCFLGFSFQTQNMTLIAPAAVRREKTVIASAFGFSEFNAGLVSTQIRARIGGTHDSVRVDETVKCSELIDKYALAFRA